MEARTTLGLKASTQPSSKIRPRAPAASAVRMMVPRLPGSWIRSRITTGALLSKSLSGMIAFLLCGFPYSSKTLPRHLLCFFAIASGFSCRKSFSGIEITASTPWGVLVSLSFAITLSSTWYSPAPFASAVFIISSSRPSSDLVKNRSVTSP